MYTQNKKKYLDYTVLNGISFLAIWVIYKYALFIRISDLSSLESKAVLLALAVVFLIIGVLSDMESHRSLINAVSNTAAGMAVYWCISYWNRGSSTIILINIVIALFIIMVICVAIHSFAFHSSEKKLFFYKLKTGIYHYFLLFFIIIVMFNNRNVLFQDVEYQYPETDSHAELIRENADRLNALSDDIWDGLSNEDKLESLQEVINIEQEYLGMPEEISIMDCPIEQNGIGYTRGEYFHSCRMIIIDTDSLTYGSLHDSLSIVLHEMYHGYEHCVLEAYLKADDNSRRLRLFEDAEIYYDEFKNYVDGSDDYDGYHRQRVESDSRQYEKNADMYIDIVKQSQKEKEKYGLWLSDDSE